MTTDIETLPFRVTGDVQEILAACPGFVLAQSWKHLADMSVADVDATGWADVAYDIPGKGKIVEARVCRTRNAIAANYTDAYMRRRDPDATVIGDAWPTDKKSYNDLFNRDFQTTRQETFDWLKTQKLCVLPFYAGDRTHGLPALVIAPANAGFFALGLAMLQGMITPDEISPDYTPRAVIYVAPPFRHTHFEGKQVVVHHRTDEIHELFSYNLYPGPSAKKGVYGVLIQLGEREGWVTAHCSTVQAVTPYDNIVTVMHEGASGGGKSEMLEHAHRERDGRLLLGVNTVDGDTRHLSLPRTCELHPVTDDMALCLPEHQTGNGKLTVCDAEDSWFVRVNHITEYGTDPHLEKLTIQPPEPLLTLNIEAHPGATTLIWEHIEDSPGEPCPNPRVIVPRHCVPDVVDGPVTVDIRSFGVRTPPCTKDKPTYGIFGLLQILPPSLAWLWRLVAPRGHGNPSIVDDTGGLVSEGVGSYWPFATGRRVDQANRSSNRCSARPQHKTFRADSQSACRRVVDRLHAAMGGDRELPRRDAVWLSYAPNRSFPARCSLLGYAPKQIVVEGTPIPPYFLRVELQNDVGTRSPDAGAATAGLLQETARKISGPRSPAAQTQHHLRLYRRRTADSGGQCWRPTSVATF